MNRVNCEQDFPLRKIQGQPPPPPLLQQLLLLQNVKRFTHPMPQQPVKRLPPGALVNPEDMKHTTLLYCKHSGGKSDKSPFTITAQDGTIAKNNKKVDCKACIKIKVFNNDSSRVISNWKHQDHDPTSIADLSGSRLPQSAKKNGLMSMWKSMSTGKWKATKQEIHKIMVTLKTLLIMVKKKKTKKKSAISGNPGKHC
ncbi:hypothetical protein PS15m_000691 [Mucor circinelloides]